MCSNRDTSGWLRPISAAICACVTCWPGDFLAREASSHADERMASGRGMGTNAIMDSGGEFTGALGPYRFQGKPTMSQCQFCWFVGGE
jgi:hypothetical protein